MFNARLSGALLGVVLALCFARLAPDLREVVSALSDTELAVPNDNRQRAELILRTTPLIDGHNDFPMLLRHQLRNQIYGHDFQSANLTSHTDIQKMRRGRLGGQFWSVFIACSEDLPLGGDPIRDPEELIAKLNEPDWAVRDTLEQIDVIKRFIAAYPDDLQLCTEPRCVRQAHRSGKTASMIGVEGGHQTGNSLGALRLFHELGARYMTLTHNCDNAYAMAASSLATAEKDTGLSAFGRSLVREMNRLSMLVDLSHVSTKTMHDTLDVTRAPVIFSHSGTFALSKHWRNVPDDVLRRLPDNGGVVMIPMVSYFVNFEHPEEATVEGVVDQILHVARIAGWEHVGLGSDFDGTVHVARGIEVLYPTHRHTRTESASSAKLEHGKNSYMKLQNVEKFPNLIASLLARGVSDEHARMVTGENLLRVWTAAEEVGKKLRQQEKASEDYWKGRNEDSWEPRMPDVPTLFDGGRSER